MKKLLLIALVAAGCGEKEQKRAMCDYAPPKDYVLMTDAVSGWYTYIHQGYAAVEYLYEYRHIAEYAMYYSTNPTMYEDSCEAKYAIYNYLKQTGATLVPVHPQTPTIIKTPSIASR